MTSRMSWSMGAAGLTEKLTLAGPWHHLSFLQLPQGTHRFFRPWSFASRATGGPRLWNRRRLRPAVLKQRQLLGHVGYVVHLGILLAQIFDRVAQVDPRLAVPEDEP